MKRLVLLSVVLCAASGCAVFEAGMKAGAEITLNAIQARLPGSEAIIAGAKDLANKGIEEGVLLAAEKAAQAANAILLHMIRRAGLSPWDFDYDGDRALDIDEMTDALAAVDRKAKEQPNEVPWDVQLASLLGVLGLGYTALKTANRYREKKGREAIKAVLNGDAPPPPTNGGAIPTGNIATG